MDRRDFLKYTTFGTLLVGTGLGVSQQKLSRFVHYDGKYIYPGRVENWPGVEVKFSTCKQCHSDCALMARVYKGTIIKLDGNPYDIQTTEPPLKQETPVRKAIASKRAHSLCPRGQAGRQTVYDPYRIYKPLKRIGPRGSGKFKTISYEQLIDEVVNGGYLFKDVPGEENRFVEGFKHLWNNGKNRFVPANEKYPDFGPKTNQFVAYWGRAEGGQHDMIIRFASALGSVNAIPHVAVCELTHHVATHATFGVHMLKPDQPNAELVLVFGANYYEANFPMQTLGRRSAEATASGKKVVFIDPRGGKQIAHADYIPIKPGGDGAFAMGMVRWIIENKRYNEKYLEIPNYKDAIKQGEPNFSNASWLIIADESHPDYGMFLKSGEEAMVIDKATRMPMKSSVSMRAELWPTGFLSTKPIEVNGVKCLTGMQYLWKEAGKYSYDFYEKEAGISKRTIINLTKEFTSHGRRVAADLYRGPAMHANGFYNSRAILLLNVLVGSVDWKGGYIAGGGHADYMNGVYNLKRWPNYVPTSGVKISREGSFYEETMEYKERLKKGSPFPAERPWFPFGFGIWQEIWAGIYFQYPYPVKILFQHMANPAWAQPGMGGANDESLMWVRMIKDLDKVPLFIATDIMIAESSAYADYIIPDATYLEGWGMLHGYPTYPTSRISIRQPIIEPVTEKTKDGAPITMEQFLIDVAKKLGLPGFGKNAFLEGGNLDYPEDYYLKMVANIAFDDKHLFKKVGNKLVKQGPVPDANDYEMKFIEPYMKKYPNALKPSEWKKAAYVLSRGGRFEDSDVAYLPFGQPEWTSHRLGEKRKAFKIYDEEVAKTHNAITGERFDGCVKLEPPKNMKGQLLSDIYSKKEYPFMLSTYKVPIHSKSRTMSDPWLLELLPGNFLEINEVDAKKLNLKNGDTVRLISPAYPKGVLAKIRIRFALRPGVVTYSQAFGRWRYGSGKWYINGKMYEGDPARNEGIHPNHLMLLDHSIAAKDGWTTVLEDAVGGGMVYFDTPVRIEKVT